MERMGHVQGLALNACKPQALEHLLDGLGSAGDDNILGTVNRGNGDVLVKGFMMSVVL
jgi:hypothetical protein